MILDPPPVEERWDPRDLLDDRTEPFYRWLIKHRIVKATSIRHALGQQHTIEDLFQSASLRLVQCPPLKTYARATVLAVALKSTVREMAGYRARRHYANFKVTSFAEETSAEDFADPHCPQPFQLTNESWFDFAEIVERELRMLNQVDREVIRLRFGFDDELTQIEIAARFCVTKSRIHQRELRALKRLRTCIESRVQQTATRRFGHRLKQAMLAD